MRIPLVVRCAVRYPLAWHADTAKPRATAQESTCRMGVVLVAGEDAKRFAGSHPFRSKPTSASQLELSSSRPRLFLGSTASSALKAL